MTRSAGILLPVSALPSAYGIGDLGTAAFSFIDFLVSAGQSYWQVLPLGPTTEAYSFSPYGSFSAFALDQLLLDPEDLVARGYAAKQDCVSLKQAVGPVRYIVTAQAKRVFLKKAYAKFLKQAKPVAYLNFIQTKTWLKDYALFAALSDHFQLPWWEWPEQIRRREPQALVEYQEKLVSKIGFHQFVQWLAAEQWQKLYTYAQVNKIKIIGDIPMFVIHDSVDVWSHPEDFKLDEQYKLPVVAGVPPDLFNDQGQRWGVPVYNWAKMATTGYAWWIERLKRSRELFDLVRLDHFRGFAAYYEIPAAAQDGRSGAWVPGPGQHLFEAVRQALGELPFIAEDLGVITPDVNELLKSLGIPGLRVALIGFMDYPNYGEYSSHNVLQHPENCIAYTTTHDFETVVGWLKNSQGAARDYALRILLGEESDWHWKFIEYTYGSRAELVMVQMQDLLGLDNSARMNFPGTEDIEKNWTWRVAPKVLTKKLAKQLRASTLAAGRCTDK